jgi:8-oxo-dGTP pyrophosphatase MutT (NUDIX family)
MEEYQIEVGEGLIQDWLAKIGEKPGEVVMVFLRPGGRVLLNTKEFYPTGTYRLPTGSMHRDETPEDALVREAQEETGFRVRAQDKLGTIHWVFRHGGDTVEYYSHVFLIPETTDQPVVEDPHERITGYKEVAIRDLRRVGDELMNMPDRWRDWGVFRGLVHVFVHDKLCNSH